MEVLGPAQLLSHVPGLLRLVSCFTVLCGVPDTITSSQAPVAAAPAPYSRRPDISRINGLGACQERSDARVPG